MTQQTTTYDHFEVVLRPDGTPWVLGQGAMGVTYRAFDKRLQCHVALKVIQSALFSDHVAKERFLREARSAAAVHHPNVASVFYLGQAGEEVFYTMELVEGVSIEEELRAKGKMEPAFALTIAIQVCRALHALHRAGLVHRDIKPANIMLLNSGDGQMTAKLVDFGLAKSVVGGGNGATLSVAPGFLGTPYFASPEQINEEEVDTRSDIYSLGATLYSMLAGRPPFSGTLANVFHESLHEPPPLEFIPEGFRSLLEKMLAKRPEDRFQTPQELRSSLETALLQAVTNVQKSSHDLPGPALPISIEPVRPPQAEAPGGRASPPSFSLLELLKKRRALPPAEATAVLGAVAAELDRQGASGEPVVSRSLGSIFLSGTGLTFANVAGCPDLGVAFQPEAPLVPDATIHVEATDDRIQAMPFPQLLAHLAYELLGGYHQGKDGWAPVPALSAHGNSVLRRGMENGRAFVTASEFVAALKPPQPRRQADANRPPQKKVVAAENLHAESHPAPEPKASALRWWVLGLASAGLAGLAVFFVFSPPRHNEVSPPEVQAEPSPIVAPAPEVAPPAEDPAAPFLRAAEQCRDREDNAGMLDNFAKALEVSPSLEEPRKQMEMISAGLRSNAVRLTHQKFSSLRKPLEAAARHNVVSAQILLGEWLRTSEPQEALKWFAAAAANGQTEAMTQAGLMMTNGLGREAPDFPAAVGWFQQGAAAGDSDAMVSLADCYLLGKGVARNEMKAVEILQAASALNHPQGMNKLGDLLKKGIPGYFPPNYEEALRLFSSSQKLGNGDAQANLGVMYVNGLGVPKDMKKAFALWKEGAEKLGSPACMFFYAVALEGGLLGERQPTEARDWYSRAAKAGNRTAVDWCQKNGVPTDR